VDDFEVSTNGQPLDTTRALRRIKGTFGQNGASYSRGTCPTYSSKRPMPSRTKILRSPRARQGSSRVVGRSDPAVRGFGLDETLGRARCRLLCDGRRPNGPSNIAVLFDNNEGVHVEMMLYSMTRTDTWARGTATPSTRVCFKAETL
jgi:hypothetical protein